MTLCYYIKNKVSNMYDTEFGLFLLILQLIMPNKQRNSWLTRYRTKETNKKYT